MRGQTVRRSASLVLASMLLVGISAARAAFRRSQTSQEITNIMMEITQYYNDFTVYHPSGVDSAGVDCGKLSSSAGVINHTKAWPANWTSTRHPLVRCLAPGEVGDPVNPPMPVDVVGGVATRYYHPLLPKGKTKSVTDSSGNYIYFVDPYGNPYRYLEDGRRPDRTISRVNSHEPIVWSAGADGLEDPLNDQIDRDSAGNSDGRVDDVKELVDDICSWNQ